MANGQALLSASRRRWEDVSSAGQGSPLWRALLVRRSPIAQRVDMHAEQLRFDEWRESEPWQFEG